MKLLAASLLAIFTVATVQAGSFGGPPPFTNGSPLQSGVEGTYQGSLRGKGLSGVMTFAYDGSGNPVTGANYVIFADGGVYLGDLQANIQNVTLAGVLEAPSSATPPPQTSSFAATTQSTGGSFSGKFNTKSAFYSFSGRGAFQLFSQPILPDGSISGDFVSITKKFRLSGARISQTAN